MGLTALRFLDLTGTPIVDLMAVQGLPNLQGVEGAPVAEKQRFDEYRAQKGLRAVGDRMRE